MRYRWIFVIALMAIAVLFITSAVAQSSNQVPTAQAGTTVSSAAPMFVDLESLPQLTPLEAAVGGVKATPAPRSGVSEEVYRARKAHVAGLAPAMDVPVELGPAPAFSDDVAMMTPGSSKNLEGIDASMCGGWIPSDHALAVGPTYIVQVLNECIRVTNQTGVVQAGFPKSLQTFFAASGSIFDPRALWDPYKSRYIISAIDGSKWYIAISKNNNPVTGGWWIYTVTNTQVGLQSNDFIDFDTLGQDKDVLYVGATIFPAAGGMGNRMLFLPKAKMVAGQPMGSFIFGFNFNLGGQQLDSIQPANHSFSTDYPRAGFLVNSLNINFGGGQCVNGCNGLVVWAISNALVVAGSPGIQMTAVVVPTNFTYTMPPNALQPGCSNPTALCALDTGDTRISGEVTYAKGQLWGSLNTKRLGNNTPTVLWFTLRPYLNDGNAACTGAFLNKCAQIAGAELVNEDMYFAGGRGNSGCDFFGVPVVDAEGNATMVANYSDLSSYPGTFYASRRTTQAKNTMHDAGTWLRGGQGFYQALDSQNRNRWGDYTAAQIQGNANFWFAGQYAKTFGASRIWGTAIGKNAFTARNQP
jgi:hypothetical protein